MKKKSAYFITLIILPCVCYACTKVYTRDDFNTMEGKTFYLLPVESSFMVPASLFSWRKVEENISGSVIKGVKEFDVIKFKECVEKGYGISVDTTYFERARSDENDSKLYFRALKDANATGSRSFTAILSTGYNGYVDSALYTEIDEIKKNKPCIIISHDTTIDDNEVKSRIRISLLVNDENNGELTLGRSMSWRRSGTDETFDVKSIDYNAIYEGLVKITEYRYNNVSGWGLSGGESCYLDGSK